MWSRSEIEDIAADAAADAAADLAPESTGGDDLSGQVQLLQDQIDSLQRQNEYLQERIDSQKAINDEIYGNVGRLYDWMNEHPH